MSKKVIFISTIIIFLSALFLFGPLGNKQALAGAEKITWKLATKMPTESVEGKTFSFFAKRAEELSNGRMKMQLFPSEQLGDILTSLEMLGAGTIQMYLEAPDDYHHFVPGFATLSLPYFLTDRDQYLSFLSSSLVESWRDELVQKHGFSFLGELGKIQRGPWRVIVANKPVLSLADVNGLKMRVFRSEPYQQAWEHLGANTIILPWTEIYQSLQLHMIDAVTSPIGLVRGMKFYEVGKYVIRTNEYSQSLCFAMNNKAWEKLSTELQRALLRAYDEAAEFNAGVLSKEAEEAVTDMVQNSGVWFVRLPTSELNKFRDKLVPLYKQWAKEKKYGLSDEALKEALKK